MVLSRLDLLVLQRLFLCSKRVLDDDGLDHCRGLFHSHGLTHVDRLLYLRHFGGRLLGGRLLADWLVRRLAVERDLLRPDRLGGLFRFLARLDVVGRLLPLEADLALPERLLTCLRLVLRGFCSGWLFLSRRLDLGHALVLRLRLTPEGDLLLPDRLVAHD